MQGQEIGPEEPDQGDLSGLTEEQWEEIGVAERLAAGISYQAWRVTVTATLGLFTWVTLLWVGSVLGWTTTAWGR